MLQLRVLKLCSSMSECLREKISAYHIETVFSLAMEAGFAAIDTGNFTQATLIQAADGEFVRFILFYIFAKCIYSSLACFAICRESTCYDILPANRWTFQLPRHLRWLDIVIYVVRPDERHVLQARSRRPRRKHPLDVPCPPGRVRNSFRHVDGDTIHRRQQRAIDVGEGQLGGGRQKREDLVRDDCSDGRIQSH